MTRTRKLALLPQVQIIRLDDMTPDDAEYKELVKVRSGDVDSIIARRLFKGGPVLNVTIEAAEVDDGNMFFGADDPWENYRNLVDAANAASLAAQQLLSMIYRGTATESG
jgi:hypothetical protein